MGHRWSALHDDSGQARNEDSSVTDTGLENVTRGARRTSRPHQAHF
jgi:hypothetical protein